MENLEEIIEGILFVAGESVGFYDIAEKLNIDIKDVKNATQNLQTKHKDNKSGFQVLIFNDKAQLSSNPDYADKIAEVLNPIKEKQLTKAVLEVCAIIAYKQPITRLEVENVRGVNSDYAISVLVENNLIEVVGRKDAVGKPLLFGTTDNFLKKFDLGSLQDLPDYDELIERISVLHNTKEDNSLFNFDNNEENSTIELNKELQDNSLSEEDENIIVHSEISISREEIDSYKDDIEDEIDKLLGDEPSYINFDIDEDIV